MEKKLFREKSLDRISSPENLTDYIKVTTPSVWMILVAIMLLLVGICCWGVFGRLNTKIKTIIMSTGSYMYAIVEDTEAERISVGDALTVGDRTYLVSGFGKEPIQLSMEDSSYLMHLFGKTEDCWVVILSISDVYVLSNGATGQDRLPTGTYEGAVIIDSVSPMSFVVN